MQFTPNSPRTKTVKSINRTPKFQKHLPLTFNSISATHEIYLKVQTTLNNNPCVYLDCKPYSFP